MARPIKKGLSYFPKDVDYYEDFKIMDLMNEYGPLGQTIYDVVISMIYREGYFLEFKNFEQLKKNLPVKIIKTIGNRWINKKDFVLQVILSCADIGLFDYDLLMQGVVTSVGVQRRYDTVTVRNKVQKEKYRLIDKNGQPLLNEPIKGVSVTETNINVTENRDSATDMQQKKIKVNKSKENKIMYFDSEKVNDAFAAYLAMRERSTPVPGSKIVNLIEQLNTFKDKGCSDDELVEIVKEATSKGWMNFYKSDKKKPEQSKANFTERNYSKDDMESLERKLLIRR